MTNQQKMGFIDMSWKGMKVTYCPMWGSAVMISGTERVKLIADRFPGMTDVLIRLATDEADNMNAPRQAGQEEDN